MGSQQFRPVTQSPQVFVARSCGELSSWYWSGGPGTGLGLLATEIPPKFLSTKRGYGTSLLHISTPPTSPMDVVSLIP